jgi:hypothetical protein
MSGFEAAGLALGLWPVVLNLAEMYKASKDGRAMTSLAMKIRTYEIIFKQSVSKLLQGDEDLLSKDRVGLLSGQEEFIAIWTDVEFAARLKRRIDPQILPILEHHMMEIFKLLDALKKNIEPKDGEVIVSDARVPHSSICLRNMNI